MKKILIISLFLVALSFVSLFSFPKSALAIACTTNGTNNYCGTNNTSPTGVYPYYTSYAVKNSCVNLVLQGGTACPSGSTCALTGPNTTACVTDCASKGYTCSASCSNGLVPAGSNGYYCVGGGSCCAPAATVAPTNPPATECTSGTRRCIGTSGSTTTYQTCTNGIWGGDETCPTTGTFCYTLTTSPFASCKAPTNTPLPTKPPESGTCTNNPSWSVSSHSDGPRYVIYHLKLTSNCSGTHNYRIQVTQLPTSPEILHADWRIKQDDGTWGALNSFVIRSVGASEIIDVQVIRDVNYYHPDGTYSDVRFRALLDSNTAYKDSIDQVYIVVNRPDLIVSEFVYPSGPTCQTANPTVKIKNIGWVKITTDFRVTVFNGSSDTNNYTVTQAVDHAEEINLSSKFTGMVYPPVGNYTAKATVDSNKNVTEEDEDNDKDSKYNTTTCVTPPVTVPPTIPPPTIAPSMYTISGGVFIDTGGVTGSKDSGEFFADGLSGRPAATVRINGVNYPVTSSGFVSNPLPAGTYAISYINFPAAGYTLTFPPIQPPTVSVKIGSGCTDAGGDSSCTATNNIINLHFGIRPGGVGEKWIQGAGGDMRIDNGLDNPIPDSEYFSKNSTLPFLDPGIVFGTRLDLGTPNTADKASIKKWFIEDVKYSFPVVKTAYNEMKLILYKGGVFTTAAPIFTSACSGPVPSCSLIPNLPNGVYTTTSNVTLNSSSDYTFPNNKNYIFMIDGDLRIQNNIIIPKGSTAIFIVSGNIIVGGNVKRIDGIFSTDNDFTVESQSAGADTQLVINGSVIANAGLNASPGRFINKRDLPDNKEAPSIKINYRPDFVLHAPELIRYQNYTIKEVAPGSR